MRVATIDGLVTLFYDGSKELFNETFDEEFWWHYCGDGMHNEHDWEDWNLSNECKNYWRERLSWQQVIIVDGVTEIPEKTFTRCFKIKRVIFANTVVRIGRYAFLSCKCLIFVKWPINLEYIGLKALSQCYLSSIFIPPTCREICDYAFEGNNNLSVLHVPRETELGEKIIFGTALAEASPIETQHHVGWYDEGNDDMNQWLKNMNNDDQFALHRACSSFQPMKEVIYPIILQKGLKAFKEKNSAGIIPSKYLQENSYTDLTEKEIIHDYLMKMMGEVE
ncbi:hypothetical protein CTEN210_00262 [Chaetoceros tenuissimus]|uniref:Leucine-rich repeat domain-containing protein n=1 Tax=Chaetoceros tenuissimus TaxID=426638 RepID=A0AAD3GYZ6_9STRA|nr:hypothetical protein CTEN210_00262 [Chaetoceros tenuissimus]